MRGRTGTAEERRWVETTEAYGEEEIDPCLRSLIMANGRSLENPAVELTAHIGSQREHRE